MISFLEVLERATTGPMMSAKEYDMKVFIPAVREVVKKYKIKFDANNPCPHDDDLADRVYQAGLELYSKVGSYCTDTERTINFTKEEIEQAVYECPKEVYFGEGPDRVQWGGRMPDDNTLPHCHVGSGTNTTEEVALKMVEAYGLITRAKTTSIPSLTTVGGLNASSASPMETLAAINMMRIAREGLRRAGRPGMAIIDLHPSCSSGIGTIASSNPEFGARKSDGWIVAPHAELKINYDSLNQVAYLSSWGANIGQEAGPIMGGYAGGPEGAAVVTLAYAFHGILVVRATYHLTYPIQMLHVCSTTPEMIYVISTSSQAFARNIGAPYYALGYASAGSATKQYFYEAAAYLLAIQSSGIGIEDVHPNKAVGTNQALPIDSEFTCAFGHGNIGITRKEANSIIKKLMESYMSGIKKPPKGRSLNECYDLETMKPDDELLKLYDEVIKELKNYGIGFK
ncbi:MAG: monomethylamine:corrinoid methyltransferase [Planctomycetota bacterium]|jgi:methylamine--corrinoid protein Co-methyltransferase